MLVLQSNVMPLLLIRMDLILAQASSRVTRAISHLYQTSHLYHTGDSNLHLTLYGYPFISTPNPHRRSRGAVRTANTEFQLSVNFAQYQ